jgi:hypothetical protein
MKPEAILSGLGNISRFQANENKQFTISSNKSDNNTNMLINIKFYKPFLLFIL